MAEHVTRCPHCQTSFRVRDEHLSVARGNVRCGSCLQVFNAKAHFVDNTSAPAAIKSAAAARPVAAAHMTAAQPTAPVRATTPSVSPAQKTAAPIDDGAGINLEDQEEVSADELFDSMFGSMDDDDEPGHHDDDGLFDFMVSDSSADTGAMDFNFSDSAPASKTSSKKSAPVEENFDDMLIHDDMDGEEDDEKDAGNSLFASIGMSEVGISKRPSSPFTEIHIDESLLDMVDQHPVVGQSNSSSKHKEAVDPDEAWAQALLDDDDAEDVPDSIQKELNMPTQKARSALQPAAAKPEVATPHKNTVTTGKQSTSASKPATAAPASASNRRAGGSVSFGLADEQPEDKPAPTNNAGILGAPLTDSSSKQPPVKPREVAESLQPEPLKLELPKRSQAAGWAWGSAALVLLAAIQIFYFNFPSWSRTPQWRPFYTSICSTLGCNLPTLQDMNNLRARNLVVRSHPSLANALVVDTLLQNDAAYDQPFPDMTLIFRDLEENVVASRRFTPDEYLSGELAGTTSIPGLTPVHVALEILDPGQNAVSYSIQLVANQ